MRAMAAVVGAVLLVSSCRCAEKAAPKPPELPVTQKAAAPVVPPGAPLVQRESVGGGLNVDPKSSASTASLATGADGQPVIAWAELNQVHVQRWSGSAWEPLGGGPASGGAQRATGSPQLSLGRDGSVWVAFKEMNERDVARGRVVKLDAGAWRDVGARLGEKDHVYEFAFSAQTSPALFAWTEADGELRRLRVQQLVGDAWKPLGSGTLMVSEKATVLQAPAVAALSDGAPVLAWLERQPGAVTAQLQRWDAAGSKWLSLPPLDQPADGDSSVTLVASPEGTLYSSLSWNAGLRPFRVLAPGADKWTELPLPPQAGGPIRLTALGAELGFSFAHEGMRLARWNGKAWRLLDPKVFTGGGNAVPVAFGSKGELYAAWQDTGAEGGDNARLKVNRYR